jgi:hypothetical protein
VRTLIRKYLDKRILFYTTRDVNELRQVNDQTAELQKELWSAVATPATVQPTPVVALTVAGMNDVLNSQGYTQAAWWNRIPHIAWRLMAAMAVCCNLLFGYGARTPKTHPVLLLVLPLVLSIAFMLIADIDSPRGSFIHVAPQNLLSLSESLRPKSSSVRLIAASDHVYHCPNRVDSRLDLRACISCCFPVFGRRRARPLTIFEAFVRGR